jgi:hypothetical protein
MNALLVHEGFLEPAACRLLVDYFQRRIGELGSEDVSPAFSLRVIRYRDILTAHPEAEVVRVISAARFIASQRIAEFFRAGCVLPEESQIVVWQTGMAQPVHRDTLRPTTTYVALCYLNDDYEGGGTFFPGIGTVTPKAGMMLAFHGATVAHGVTTVRSGVRYVMPIWFTDDLRALEA